VSYIERATPVPIVHPDNDPKRWFIPAHSDELGDWVFFLDTGYSYSTCDDDFVAAMSLSTRGQVTVRGELGRIPAVKASLPTMQLGGHEIKNLTCLVRDLDSTSSISDPREVRVAGVLGIDVLRPFLTTIDPERAVLLLDKPTRQNRLRKRDENVVRLRREYSVGTRILVPIQVGDTEAFPIIDTGASGTHLDGARLGLIPTITKQEVIVRGSGQQSLAVRNLAFYEEEVGIAEDGIGLVTLTDRPRSRWTPGLLGLNVLSNYYQVYDWRRRYARYDRVEPMDVPTWSDWNKSNVPPGVTF
jgi:hypothetical protein